MGFSNDQAHFFDRFEINEQKLIEKGFKENTNMNSLSKIFESLGIDRELAQSNSQTIHNIAININNIIKSSINSQELKTIKFIINKSLKDNIILTHADKVNSIIAIKKNDYVEKTQAFMNSGDFQNP